MNNTPNTRCLSLSIAIALVASAGHVRAQHAGDVWIGRNAAGQLKIDAVHGFNTLNVVVLPATDPPGAWSSNNPGFDKIATAYPEIDLYTLDSGHDVWLEVISIDAGSYVVVPPSGAILDAPGDRARLSSGSLLHKHLLWVVDGEDPGYDPSQCVWNMVFILRDLGTTGYTASAPFTLHFATHTVVRADLDCDGDVDGSDFGLFASCFNGTGSAVSDVCRNADLDDDGSVDGVDFGLFSACFNGSGNPPACPP